MKKILLLACSCLVAICMKAVETTDYITIKEATLNPDGTTEVKLTFSLVGSTNKYSGYNMDIHFPEGMEVCYNKSNKPNVTMKKPSLYPYSEEEDEETEEMVKTYTHTISSSYGVVGDRVLRVACLSTVNDVFTSEGGDLFTVTVKVSPFAKPGKASIKIDGVALKVAGGDEYDPVERTDENVTISTAATAPVTISSNKWSTCILPFDAELPTGVTAYSTSAKTTIDDADYLVLSKVNALEGYKPYILYSETAYSGSLEGTVDATKYPTEGYVTDGYLNGAITVQQITNGFVLQNLTEGMKFYATGGQTFSIPAGKCWVTLPSAEAKAFGFALEDETGVKPIRDLKQYENEVYDLSGKKIDIRQTRVNHIYIINGQKVLKTK